MVPAQECRGGNEERRPSRSGKDPAKTGEHYPIGWLVADAPDLAAQDLELVAQHQDLDVLLGRGHTLDAHEIEHA